MSRKARPAKLDENVDAAEDAITLVLAEYAAHNGDGSYTIIRGGLEHWKTELPLNLRLTGFVQMKPGALNPGKHALVARAVIAGLEIWAVTGEVQVEVNAQSRLILPIDATVQHYGECLISVTIGKHTTVRPFVIRAIEAT